MDINNLLKSKKGVRALVLLVMGKLRRVINNGNGNPVFRDNFDDVIEDIFGVKELAKDLSRCRTDEDFVNILSEIGIENAIKLTNDPDNFSALNSVVKLNHSLAALKRKQRKLSKKGKKIPKEIKKQYEWEVNTYDDAISSFRKLLGVKSVKKPWKRQFSTLTEFIDRDIFDDDEYDYLSLSDDDDYEDNSELSQILDALTKKSSRKSNANFTSSKFYDADEDMDDDDDEEEDDSDDEEDERYLELANQVSSLTEAIQLLVNTQKADAPVFVNNVEKAKNPVNAASGNADIKALTKMMTAIYSKVNNQEKILEELIDGLGDDDSDEEPEIQTVIQDEIVSDMVNENITVNDFIHKHAGYAESAPSVKNESFSGSSVDDKTTKDMIHDFNINNPDIPQTIV